MKILTAYLWNFAFVEAKTPTPLKPGAEKDRFVRVPPADKEYLVGHLLKDPEIQPVEVGGTWHPRKPTSADKPDLVILHFHGGAYIMGDGRDHDAGYAARTLLKNSKADFVFCPQYRLASNPGGRFPAALQDAVAFYLYVLNTVGVPPHKIAVGGDSAGANLTLALQRYLVEHGKETGLPNFATSWLHSPWVNPASSFKSKADFDRAPNRPFDYINGEFGSWGAECYAPDQSTGLTIADPYISFKGNAFYTPIPTWISAGESEVLLHDQIRLYEEMKAIKENVVELSIEPNSPHDIVSRFSFMVAPSLLIRNLDLDRLDQYLSRRSCQRREEGSEVPRLARVFLDGACDGPRGPGRRNL